MRACVCACVCVCAASPLKVLSALQDVVDFPLTSALILRVLRQQEQRPRDRASCRVVACQNQTNTMTTHIENHDDDEEEDNGGGGGSDDDDDDNDDDDDDDDDDANS